MRNSIKNYLKTLSIYKKELLISSLFDILGTTFATVLIYFLFRISMTILVKFEFKMLLNAIPILNSIITAILLIWLTLTAIFILIKYIILIAKITNKLEENIINEVQI